MLAILILLSACEGIDPFVKKDSGQGQATQVADNSSVTATDVGVIVFDSVTRRMIENYYRNNPHLMGTQTTETSGGSGKGKKHKKGMPPGLAKRKQLPPGLAKKDKLPPGLQKKMLPGDLESQLQPTPQGIERVRVDDKVLLIQKSTELVLDIIELAVK